jgi:hypothetical protein
MTRIVGNQNRTEFILDPVEAWHRGRVLDQMLAAARTPVERGVTRAPHRYLMPSTMRGSLNRRAG